MISEEKRKGDDLQYLLSSYNEMHQGLQYFQLLCILGFLPPAPTLSFCATKLSLDPQVDVIFMGCFPIQWGG